MQIEPIVRGLVQGLLVDGQQPVAVDPTVDVLVRQIRGMPGLMCFGMQVLLFVFDGYGLVRRVVAFSGPRLHRAADHRRMGGCTPWPVSGHD